MLHEKNKKKEAYIEACMDEIEYIPKYSIGKGSISPRQAYRIIKDELLDEGNSRQNLATFCQTYMEDEAIKIMSETLDKNSIDKSEYPRTAELESRCVNIIADLWNAPQDGEFIGTSTIGSSEAGMLAGLTMKLNWLKSNPENKNKKPNLVISSSYQVCWEKFCSYWDVELREVPISEECLSLDVEKVIDYIDDSTIGVVAILGLTYTGKFDDIFGLNEVLERYNKTVDYKIPIHVDAASGGFFTPFVNPELEWDFRLKNVLSINASGHKYGLVYPGIGWVIWRNKELLPKKLIFDVNYLGGDVPTIGINFSHSASQLIGQYYSFIRYGFKGYKNIHEKTKRVALYMSKEIEDTGYFHIYNDGENLPVICYKEKEGLKWDLFDLSDRLLMKGWQVPAYTLSKGVEKTVVQRIVCRADFSINMAETFLDDFKKAIEELNKYNEEKCTKSCKVFTH